MNEQQTLDSLNGIFLFIEGTSCSHVILSSIVCSCVFLSVATQRRRRRYLVASAACISLALLLITLRFLIALYFPDQNLLAMHEIDSLFLS